MWESVRPRGDLTPAEQALFLAFREPVQQRLVAKLEKYKGDQMVLSTAIQETIEAVQAVHTTADEEGARRAMSF